MTWAEFRIRQFAYRREEKSRWYHTRFIAYHALIGSHYNPKKIPKSIDRFMQLDDKKLKKLTDTQLEAMRKAQAKYLQEVKDRNGIN